MREHGIGYKTEHGIRYIDDGGHLIGNRFYGSGDIDNLIPQNSKVNRSGGEWYEMEKEWADICEKKGRKKGRVEVSIKPIYTDDTGRPSKIEVIYWVNGVKRKPKTIQNPKE